MSAAAIVRRAADPRPWKIAARRFGDVASVLAALGRDAPTSDARVLAARNHRAAAALAHAHGIRIDLEGQVPRAPALLVANHRSYLDPIVLAAATPLLAIAKADVRGWPVLGARMEALGVLFVHRGHAASGARVLLRARRALREGATVLNFPEGTTTRYEAPLPFLRGSFGVALREGVPIVPIRIDYDDPQIAWTGTQRFVPHYVGVACRAGIVARVRVAPPLRVAEGDDASALAERARLVIARLGELAERTVVACLDS